MDELLSKTTKAQVSILIVEDDDIDAKSVSRALRGLKIANTIVRAKDGVEALQTLRCVDLEAETFLVLLDLNMPRMGGLEFLEEVRNDPALKHLLVFVLTTSEADEDITASYNQNIAGYLVKRGVAEEFMAIFETLKYYWRIIELP